MSARRPRDAHAGRTSAPEGEGTREGEGTPESQRAPDPVEAAGDSELLDLIDHLGTLLEQSDLAELEVQSGATSIVLRRAEAVASSGGAAATAPATTAEPASPAGAPPASGPRVQAVVAPLTGIFYAAPTPEAPPFVNVGVEIVVGQVIGLIEAMKLFNEIKSDIAGRVQRVVAESGQLVKARDPLIEVAPRA
jgi:acetyl-CoA carboxylase biotin carboxyl carrier protein